MKYTSSSANATLTRYIDIEDGPVHEQAYSTAGRRFRVTRVTITYQLTETGRWEVQSGWDISVAGTVLKKDGSGSQNDHTESPESVRGYGGPIRFEEEWAWIGEIVDAARPEGNVTLPLLIKAAS